MNKINDGGPAFPADMQRRDPLTNEWSDLPPQGMSLREWLAGMALQGLLACSDVQGSANDLAKGAVAYADALLDELEAADNLGGERR